ncbi:MAG: hypothetical protein ACMXYG_04790 [Candidatus Woesearchaeota archaeon]
MEFNYGSGPGGYMHNKTEGPVNDVSDLGGPTKPTIEGPVLYGSELGQSVTEGSRFGTFLQTVTGAIRGGASKIELQTQMGGGAEAVGAESYGREAKQALKELAKANEVELTSVHAPTQVGNVSGFNPQQGFSDEQRKSSVDEIKKAIDFAADVTGGGTITFHTGEYQRPMSEAPWAILKDKNGNPILDQHGQKQYQFLGYAEEPGRAVTYMVDDRTGRIMGDVRKSNVIREPVYLTADRDYEGVDVDGKPVKIEKGDLITDDGEYIDRANPDHLFKRVAVFDSKRSRFKTEKLTWDEIEERKDSWNKKHPNEQITTEEMAYRIQVETQIMQYRGHSLYHGRMYNEEKKERDAIKTALQFYKELEQKMPKEELWKIMRSDPKTRRYVQPDLTGYDQRLPSEVLQEALLQAEQSLQYTHEASSSADAQADTLVDTLRHVKPIDQYAQSKSFQSIAEAGIHAWEKTKEGMRDGTVNRNIALTAENIFPEMGYGSHPQELKELILKSRDQMVTLLTAKEIPDPHARLKLVKDENGEEREEILNVPNPWYRPGVSKEEAKKIAENHIKANLDTQHLGMWGKHFQPIYNKEQGRMETPEETKERFKKWYMNEVKDLAESGIIGELHIVDGMISGGHVHLPAGEGELPVVDAVQYLRSKGFKGVMISEGHGEESWGPGRILHKTWENFGVPLFNKGYFSQGGGMGAPIRFTDISNSYFQQKQAPYFVFGGYAPGNDWTLWSEVPLE